MEASVSVNGSAQAARRGIKKNTRPESAVPGQSVVRDFLKQRAEKTSRPAIDSRYACFGLTIRKSRIHRWGVYATEFIPANRKVVEYTGEKISRRETKRRANESDMIYLFTLDPYWTIDGSVNGSGAEYINHCCEPNLAARIVKGHILYISLRNIHPGEELTVDYHFDKKVERVECRCGSVNCRGTINVL